ncbi:MFS transporter [Almyronema epifaneia]|uniref:MFS transporter n=1 Tax=Almyronema epifaneia S1 TaxID=2991925 RepID=A0ABW6IG38_9CYAN
MSVCDSPKQQSDRLIPSRQRLFVMLVLLLAGCLSSATGSIVAPVFPEIIEQLQIDPGWAGVLVSAHTLTTALASPVLGLLANRWGVLPILLPSLVAYAVFGVGGAIAANFWTMLLCRGLVGAASGGIAAGSIGLLSNLYGGEARSRMMGYATSALASATVVFPILGGWLGLYHWRWAFGLYGLSLPVAIAAAILFPRQVQQLSQTVDLRQAQGIRQVLQQRKIWFLFAALAAVSAIFYVVVVYAPLYLKAAIGASSLLNGIVLASRAIGAAVLSAVGANRLAKAIGLSSTIAVGFLCMALSLAAIPNLVNPSLILLTALLFGLGFGLVMPNFYSGLANLSPDSQRSGVLALGTGFASLGQFVSPLIFGSVWKAAGGSVFYAAAGIAVIIGILSWQRR